MDDFSRRADKTFDSNVASSGIINHWQVRPENHGIARSNEAI
jgi:hypothetical protein